MGEILLGNLGGTSVFGNLRDVHPRVYAMAGRFAVSAEGLIRMGRAVTAYRTGRISVAPSRSLERTTQRRHRVRDTYEHGAVVS
jgi:hypothetical protein